MKHAHTIEAMVDRQIRRWEAEREERHETPPEHEVAVITISRQAGSGGGALARRLSERLGFSLWDRQLVSEVAKRNDLREALIEKLDEGSEQRRRRAFEWLDRRKVELREEYAVGLNCVLQSVVGHGAAVIVGRGANFVVAPDRALRVRVFAPLEVRAERYALKHDLSLSKATNEVERIDRERRTWCKTTFGYDPEDAAHYDLLINTGALDEAAAAEVIAMAFQAKFSTDRPVERHSTPEREALMESTERVEASLSKPPSARVGTTAGALGAAAGAVAGTALGPVGTVAGALVGGAVGAAAAKVMVDVESDKIAHDAELDETIGVVGGEIGLRRDARGKPIVTKR